MIDAVAIIKCQAEKNASVAATEVAYKIYFQRLKDETMIRIIRSKHIPSVITIDCNSAVVIA